MRHMRFCGAIAIAMYLDTSKGERGEFTCHITFTENKGTSYARNRHTTVLVRPAAATKSGEVRSDSVLDSVAHAALSFADGDIDGLESVAAFSDSGWLIERR